jgi:hypothetical protein
LTHWTEFLQKFFTYQNLERNFWMAILVEGGAFIGAPPSETLESLSLANCNFEELFWGCTPTSWSSMCTEITSRGYSKCRDWLCV